MKHAVVVFVQASLCIPMHIKNVFSAELLSVGVRRAKGLHLHIIYFRRRHYKKELNYEKK